MKEDGGGEDDGGRVGIGASCGLMETVFRRFSASDPDDAATGSWLPPV